MEAVQIWPAKKNRFYTIVEIFGKQRGKPDNSFSNFQLKTNRDIQSRAAVANAAVILKQSLLSKALQ